MSSEAVVMPAVHEWSASLLRMHELCWAYAVFGFCNSSCCYCVGLAAQQKRHLQPAVVLCLVLDLCCCGWLAAALNTQE